MSAYAPSVAAPTPTTACAIRYRLDGSGPAAFLVDCDGEMRVYARGGLGGVMPRGRLLALLAERGCRWVPASGTIQLDPDGRGPDAPARALLGMPDLGAAGGENAALW